jgi:hypothetical protein
VIARLRSFNPVCVTWPQNVFRLLALVAREGEATGADALRRVNATRSEFMRPDVR